MTPPVNGSGNGADGTGLRGSPWTPVEGSERGAFLADLAEQLDPALEPATTAVRRWPLSFYDEYDLYEIADRAGDRERRAYLLYKRKDARPMDWTVGPIRQLNADAPLHLANDREAMEYLDFFCWSITGDEGRFLLAKRFEDLDIREPLPDAQEAKIRDALGPIEALPPKEGDPEGARRMEASVLYGRALFKAEFLLQANGQVEMVDDEPLEADLPVPEDEISSERYFVLLRRQPEAPPEEQLGSRKRKREVITAEMFLERIREETPEVLEYKLVKGRVDAESCSFDAPITIRDVQFEGSLLLGGARFKRSLRLEDCKVERLVLTDARIEGSLFCRNLRCRSESLATSEEDVSLDASGIRIDGRAELSGLEADRRVDLSGMRVEGNLALDRAQMPQLWLDDAQIGGNLSLFGATLDPKRLPAERRRDPHLAFRAHGLSVEDEADLLHLRATADLDLTGLTVGADLFLAGTRIEPYPGLKSADLILRRASLGGNLDFHWQRATRTPERPSEAEGDEPWSCIIGGDLYADPVSVKSYADLRGLHCRNAWFHHCEIGQGIGGEFVATPKGILRLRVAGDLSLHAAKVHGSVSIAGADVEKDLILDFARLDGSFQSRCRVDPKAARVSTRVAGMISLSALEAKQVEFEGGRIGRIFGITGTFGRLRLLPGVVSVDPAKPEQGCQLEPCRVGELLLQSVEVRHWVTLTGLYIDGELARKGARLETTLQMLRCGGSVEFWKPEDHLSYYEGDEIKWADGREPVPTDLSTHFRGDLDLRGLRAEGNVCLANADVTGAIRMSDARVGQDLILSTVRAPKTGEPHPTRCARLSIEMLECGGDVDLSEIHVKQATAKGGRDPWPADVCARGATVRGELSLVRSRDHDYRTSLNEDLSKERIEARIEGKLDLATSEIRHLKISGESFLGDHESAGISFERSTIQRFQVVSPFPHWVDTTNMNVARWDVGQGKSEEERQADLITFLNTSVKPRFRRATYLAVERTLRNEGHDDRADEIYRLMHETAIEKDWKEGKWRVWWRILGWTVSWGTRPWKPLVYGIVPLFVLSLLVFTPESHIVARTNYLEVDATMSPGDGPRELGFDWGVDDAIWLALRFQIPIITIEARDYWEPARQGMVIPIPRQLRRAANPWTGIPLGLSPEGFAYILYLLHYALWPLLIYGISSKLIRGRDPSD